MVSPAVARTYDTIVVGAGHNGLVAAFYLARAGLHTLVLERREIVGGTCVTEEFAPGFMASPGAYVLSMLREPIWKDMRLASRGLIVDPAGPSLNLYPDGASLHLHPDAAKTAEDVSRFSKRDARRLPAFEARLKHLARAVMPLFDRTPPDPRLRRLRDLPGLVDFGLLAFRHRKLLPEATFLFTTSMSQYLGESFESEELKSALGWESISNTLAGPTTPGTAYGLLHDHASGVGAQSWGFVQGGMGAVTRLMADAAQEAGAAIRTSAEVKRILTRGGRVAGVVLSSGEETPARVILSNADPKRTFLGLLDEAELPRAFLSAVRAYRCEGASMKINLAVAELPRVRGMDGEGIQPYHRGLLQVTKGLDGLEEDQAHARLGVPAGRPHIELCFPTVHDPSLAPEGKHVVTIGVRSQPYSLRERSWDEIKEAVTDRVVELVGGFLPNLPGAVLHRQVLSPLDLERMMYLTGGHHMHGDMAPDQLLFMRPVRGYGDYRTPVRGLYLCGAGTHPGGGVTGANGRNAARQVVKDLRRGKR